MGIDSPGCDLYIRAPVGAGGQAGALGHNTGRDIRIGAEILNRAALADEFQAASGEYFDNDSGQFTSPHFDALNPQKSEEIVGVIEAVLAEITQSDENHF